MEESVRPSDRPDSRQVDEQVGLFPTHGDIREWDETGYFALKDSETVFRRPDGTPVMFASYDGDIDRRGVCNASRLDGVVCRLLATHDGTHVPFSPELVATTGVVVEVDNRATVQGG